MDDNKIVNIESKEENGNLKITSNNTFYSEHFYFSEIYDEKKYKKFIKNVERLIRGSDEYKEYISKLRSNYTALNSDNILSNITTLDAELEFHHYPFTLYDIVDIIASHKLSVEEKFTSFSLAKEIMNLHFKNKIGLVPLSTTTHQLAHEGCLFISKKQIFGEWQYITKKYPNGISSEYKNLIKDLDKLTEKNTPSDFGGIL